MVSFLRLFIVFTVISIGLAGADWAAAQEVTFFRIGTGGTSGVGYLEGVLKEVFFPELLSVRTAL